MIKDKISKYLHASKKKISIFIVLILLSLSGLNYKNIYRLINIKTNSILNIYPTVRKCDSLQEDIEKVVSNNINGWSISVLDEDRYLIAGINSKKALIPASNIKLITTAYALHKLGSNYRLSTKLVQRSDGIFEFWGEGDPDLSQSDINTLTKKASEIFLNRTNKNSGFKIIFYDEPSQNWWSESWPIADRLQSYGSPITRLAIKSNSNYISINNPIDYFNSYLSRQIKSYGLVATIENKEYEKKPLFFTGRKVIEEIESAPMISLLSLANSESHNFTAEILLRNSADTWDPNQATSKVYRWLKDNGIPVDQFILVDGSGLSRKNRVTSIGLASLLWHMNNQNNAAFYKSSMAILGIRGTLRNFIGDESINGKFYGKTGTLSGVRAISGFLNTKNGIRYISIVSNNVYQADQSISKVLKLVSKFSQCY